MTDRQIFDWLDYLLMALTLTITIIIGAVCAMRTKSTESSYFMGDRNMGILPVTLSMLMSYISGTLIIGNTAEVYAHGATHWMAMIGSGFAYTFAAIFLVPLFFPLKITSAFEYLELRYKSRTVRMIGVLLLVLSQVFFMGISIFSPSTALAAVTDIPQWGFILMIGGIGTLYTTLGGMKAVVWTDVFQALVLFGGIFAVLIEGSIREGGLSEVWRRNREGGRLHFVTDFNPVIRVSVWSAVFGRAIGSIHMAGLAQTSMQRYNSMKSLKDAQWAAGLHFPFLVVAYSLTILCGMVVFSYFDSIGCDILRTPRLQNHNQLLSYYILNVLQVPALPGIFGAVLISGSLSTVSSSVNSLSAVMWKDIIEPFFKSARKHRVLVVKGLSLFYGAIGIAFAFCVADFSGHVFQLVISFFSGVGGPALGLFLLGAFFPFVEWIGASVGSIVGLAMGLWVILGNAVTKPYQTYMEMTVDNCTALGYNATEIKPMPQDNEDVFALYRLSYMYHPVIGALVTMVLGTFISAIVQIYKYGRLKSDVDPALVIPVFDRVCCCLPQRVREKVIGGQKDEKKVDKNGFLLHPPRLIDADSTENEEANVGEKERLQKADQVEIVAMVTHKDSKH